MGQRVRVERNNDGENSAADAEQKKSPRQADFRVAILRHGSRRDPRHHPERSQADEGRNDDAEVGEGPRRRLHESPIAEENNADRKKRG